MTAGPGDELTAEELIEALRAVAAEETSFELFAELGSLLAARYAADGAPEDLDEAIASLRSAMDTPVPPEVEPAWIEMETARLLVLRGETAQSLADVEAAITYAGRALAVLAPPADDPDPDLALACYVLGAGHLLRASYAPAGARTDWRLAADALQRCVALLPPAHSSLGEVTARLGAALTAEIQHEMDELDDSAREEWTALGERVDAALRTMGTVRKDIRDDDPYRPIARYWHGTLRTIRFLAFGGDTEDRENALTDLESYAEHPGGDGHTANICHLFAAALHLSGSAPETLRTSGKMPHFDGFAQILATGNTASPEAARLALDHLDRVAEPDPAGSPYGSMSLALRLSAEIASNGQGPVGDRLAAVLHEHGNLPQAAADDDFGRLIGLLGDLQALRAGSAELGETIESFSRFIDELGDAHPLRHVFKAVLGQVLDASAGSGNAPRPPSWEERDAAFQLLEHILRELPADHPDRASTLVRLAGLLVRGLDTRYNLERLARVRELLQEATERPAADRENEAVQHFLLVIVESCLALGGSDGAPGLRDTTERLKRAVELAPPGHQIHTLSRALLPSILAQRFRLEGDLEHLDAAMYYARTMSRAGRTADAPDSEYPVLMDWLLAVMPLMRDYDHGRLAEITAHLREQVDRLPDDRTRRLIEHDLYTLDFARTIAGHYLDPRNVQSSPEDLTTMVGTLAARARELDRNSPYYPQEAGIAGHAKIGLAFLRRDVRMLDEGLATVSEAYRAASDLGDARLWLLSMIGGALVMRYELTHDRADLSNAIEKMEEVRRATEGEAPNHLMALNLNSLAGAYHLRADERLRDQDRMGRTGLASLRARAWSVMLQTSTERAFDAAVAGGGEAAEVALWCAASGLTETAIEALESGRALVLHAATTATGIPELLGADHPDLVAEWEAAASREDDAPWQPRADVPDELTGTPQRHAQFMENLPEIHVPSALRQRVMAAIEGTDAERRLFNPATVAEIAGALRGSGAAALVYLVSHPGWRGGVALVVGPDERVHRVDLPRLSGGQGSKVAAFVQAQRERADQDESSRTAWGQALGELCDWAWSAAMEPLLDSLAGHSPDPSRTNRLILVPVGELGAVPWHAARRTVGKGGKRYACQDAVISYAASARQFVDARRREPRPWAEEPALVNVRDSNLYWTSKEIEQIHEHHYPRARLLGGRTRGANAPPFRRATGQNVLALLPGPESGGATLLHLGCHASPRPRPVDSHLTLALLESLGMTDILRQGLAGTGEVPGGLVVLAACGSDLTSSHHDEALTLATAFVAGGAVGAVGARWPVDDFPTAVLMSMFHHYLNSGYDDPAVALRAAQLWMIDPRRRVPARLAADVIARLAETPLHEPESWAAFTYQGR
ncbi:CHAT domain-containing protein [Nonomuraea sp. NPDC059007]|uniref:CHAT domain-containing protein n=1 Tax=Nonomuraea sp. NPDC059007 TaxID=3346692 RepID=UPI0036C20922